MRKIEYVRVLDIMVLIGRKDCEIYYITHKGNYNELIKIACDRNIIITSISKKEYENMEKKLKFSVDSMNGMSIEELIERPKFQ